MASAIHPRFSNYIVYDDGVVFSMRSYRLMKVNANSHKYPHLSLVDDNGVKREMYLHRLVMEAFTGEHPGMEVNHKDGNTKNAHLDNLEWCTHAANAQNAYQNAYDRRMVGSVQGGD